MPINQTTPKTLEQVVQECGRYPMEAFEFVRHGLNFTVAQMHGERKGSKDDQAFHVTGQQLCWGLRNYALHKYGMMAASVLHHWGITRTNDFGRIVFSMIESKLMAKTDEDNPRDFHQVYDFVTAFSPPARPVAASKVVFQV